MQFRLSVVKGTQKGLKVLWELTKVVVPAMMVVHLLDRTGILPHISRALAPVMGLFGLPGEAALALVTGNFIGFYAGLATIAALDLTLKQLTTISAMVMVCHGAISETALVAKAGARASWMIGARVTAMVLVGLILRFILP
ncbi:MAG TPA: nucleoside recognition domain-containing protein [Symbiobacteriaceae bacterium]|nr:nucleoside recognition domain-containing protein [Symbiobacteriaceae bacterium]